MLKTLLSLLGADYKQWRALTGVAVKQDLRSVSLGMPDQQKSAGKGNAAFRLFIRLWVYVFIGGLLSIFVGMNKDVFFTGTVLVTYNMAMVMLMVLVDFGAVVISPDDFAILGYQPVSSRTFFISRLTNVFLYTTMLSLALGIIPVVVFFFTLGFNPLLGIAALLAVLLSSITAALFLVIIYALILRVIHPNKLRRAIGYIQLLISFLLYGGYSFLPQIIDAKRIGSMAITKPAWLLLFPPAWFAGYLNLALGQSQLFYVLSALLSLAALGLLLVKVQGKLALDYADRLSSITTVSEGSKTKAGISAKQGWLFSKGEARAVALLVRNQFKYDQKFRMAVLSILPLTILYLFMVLKHGPLQDPFIAGIQELGNSWLLYLSVMMVPMLLKMSMAQSDSYKASWLFFAAPADHSRMVLASRDCIFAFFVIPYLAIMAILFFYFFHNPWHVLVHEMVLALISFLFLQINVFLSPSLPFSLPIRKMQRSSGIIFVSALGPFLAIGLLLLLFKWVYPNKLLLFGVIIGLACLCYVSEAALRKRVRRFSANFEYNG